MAMTQKVLLAADDSVFSRKALDLVRLIARADADIHVFLVHVIVPIPSLIGNPMRDELKREMTEVALTVLAPFKTALDAQGILTNVCIEQGDIASHILRLARREQVDLIVMGARGQSGIEEMLIGSVSQKVLQYSNAPVLIAR